jgi:sugar phosphate isomerase/epimerase
MPFSRREFGRLALTAIPAAAVIGRRDDVFAAFAQSKPNSLVNGVQLGTITYSYRSMPDQSAEATLKYILDSGISAIEFMGGPVEAFAGAPAPAGRGGGPGRGPGGPGGGRRGAAAGPIDPQDLPLGAKIGEWQGHQCIVPAEGGDPSAPGAGRGGGGRGRGQTPEQQAAQQEAAAKLKAWRSSVSMDPFKKLRKMFNDAGVTIYAWKQLSPSMSDEEFEYVFNVAEALGCTHTTLELPAGPEAAAQLKRIGDFALKRKIYAAYHTHTQGGMTVLDEAFAASKGNMANVDFGHWVAGGNKGGTPLDFLTKYHDRIASFHLKDRTTPEHCALNLPWGTGETPITAILQTVKKNKWKMPAAIELEYDVPEGSDAVQEVKKCLDYCRKALA